MPEHEDFYTPSRIDEQVDDLLLGRTSPAQDRHMANDLQAILEHENENARSLQKVLDKLLANPDAQPTGKIIPISDRRQQGEPTVMQTHSHLPRSGKTQSMFRVWSTLAAVLIVAALVGSMLIILNTVHQQSGHPSTVGHNGSAVIPTTIPPTPTPALQEGRVIYQSLPQDLAMPLAWSPDGKRVAMIVNRTTVESWDALTGKNVLTYATSGDLATMVAWSPDGKSLAVAGSVSIYIFNGQSAALIHSFPPMQTASATAATGGLLSFLLPQSGGNTTMDVAWSPDGRYLSASVWGTTSGVSVWDAQTGTLVKSLTGLEYAGSYLRATWQPYGHILAIVACTGTDYCTSPSANLWDTTTWQVVKRYPDIAKLAWSPDGRQLALLNTETNTQSVSIVDVSTGQQVQQITDPQALSIWDFHWSPDGGRLALDTLSKGSHNVFTISLWNVASATQAYRSSLKGCYNSSWSPDSKYIACTQAVAQKVNNNTVYSAFIVIWVA